MLIKAYRAFGGNEISHNTVTKFFKIIQEKIAQNKPPEEVFGFIQAHFVPSDKRYYSAKFIQDWDIYRVKHQDHCSNSFKIIYDQRDQFQFLKACMCLRILGYKSLDYNLKAGLLQKAMMTTKQFSVIDVEHLSYALCSGRQGTPYCVASQDQRFRKLIKLYQQLFKQSSAIQTITMAKVLSNYRQKLTVDLMALKIITNKCQLVLQHILGGQQQIQPVWLWELSVAIAFMDKEAGVKAITQSLSHIGDQTKLTLKQQIFKKWILAWLQMNSWNQSYQDQLTVKDGCVIIKAPEPKSWALGQWLLNQQFVRQQVLNQNKIKTKIQFG